MSQFKTFCRFAAILLLASCQGDVCTNRNAELSRLSPGTYEYNTALAAEMRSRNDIRYIFERFEMRDSVPHLSVTIKADGLCGKINLAVKRTDEKIKPLLDTKGVGYNGAELENLRMMPDSTGTYYLYGDVERIID